MQLIQLHEVVRFSVTGLSLEGFICGDLREKMSILYCMQMKSMRQLFTLSKQLTMHHQHEQILPHFSFTKLWCGATS